MKLLLCVVLVALGGKSALAQAPMLAPVTPQVITHGSREHREIALTFDACQTHKLSGYDAEIISILRATHTPATLMLGGYWMETHPQATRDLGHDQLFEIGNHSYLHPHMTKISVMQQKDELLKTQAVMYRLTGKQGVLFRPPYGEYDAALVRQAAALGLTTMTWEVVTGDPDKHVTAKDIIRTVLTKARPGSLVIMHMNGRGWHTAEALPIIIRELRKRGYSFVTVSHL